MKIADNDGKLALSGAICNGNIELIDLLKPEVNGEALRYACITGSESVSLLANEAIKQNITNDLDEYTKAQVYQATQIV